MSPSRSTTRIRISLASGAGSKSSPVGLIGAVALHLAVIAVTLFTWEHRLDIAQESPPVVPVDLVIPGCPPSPATLLKGLLALMNGKAQ